MKRRILGFVCNAIAVTDLRENYIFNRLFEEFGGGSEGTDRLEVAEEVDKESRLRERERSARLTLTSKKTWVSI